MIAGLKRQEGLQWWKTLSLEKKKKYVEEFEKGRDPRSLTGREIEVLYTWNTDWTTKPSRSMGTISSTYLYFNKTH